MDQPLAGAEKMLYGDVLRNDQKQNPKKKNPNKGSEKHVESQSLSGKTTCCSGGTDGPAVSKKRAAEVEATGPAAKRRRRRERKAAEKALARASASAKEANSNGRPEQALGRDQAKEVTTRAQAELAMWQEMERRERNEPEILKKFKHILRIHAMINNAIVDFF